MVYPTLRMAKEDFDDAFETADSALQSHGVIANMSSSSLRQFRNTQRSPIYQLPLETLTEIFIFTSGILDTSHELLDSSAVPPIKIVLSMAHVSSRWYKAAKSCPLLWTHIFADYAVPLVVMGLERSGNLPLTVTCWGRGKRRKAERLQELLEHVHRWETADVVITFKDLRSIAKLPAPRLKAMAIVPIVQTDAEALLGEPEDLPMANQLFHGQIPQLEVLKIHYWLKWEEASYSRLKRLDIALYLGRLPSVTGLNSMLSKCPLLETLSISAPIERPDFTLGGPGDIKLPYLKTMRIRAFSPLALSTFVFRLDFPSVEIVELEPDVSLVEEPDEADAILFMVTMIPIVPILERLSPLATAVLLTLEEDEGVEFSFLGQYASSQPGPSAQCKEIKLSRFPWTDVMRFTTARCPSFVKQCRFLNIIGGGGEGYSSTTPELVATVTALHSLETVTLTGTPDSATLLSMFLDSGRRETDLISHPARWAGLDEVCLEGCLCYQKEGILKELEKWRDRRQRRVQRSQPRVIIDNEGCRNCGTLRGEMRGIVEEGNPFSDSETSISDEGEGEGEDVVS